MAKSKYSVRYKLTLEENKARIRKYQREWRKNNPDKHHPKTPEARALGAKKRKEWIAKNPERDKQNQLNYRIRTRNKVLSHYGAFCACCGEKEEAFLCIDHIHNGRGNPAHRPSNGINHWIIQNNFPDTVQVLCYNCNGAKESRGICPHKLR